MTLVLRNPHSVRAALEARPHDVLEVRLPPTKPSEMWASVAELAHSKGIAIRTDLTEQRPLKSHRGGKEDKHERTGAASAMVRERPDVSLEQLWTGVQTAPLGVWLAFDCLQDPHNVGAIFRSAAFFGIRGVCLMKDRSAPLTATVYDVSSGGMEYVPFAQVANLAQALKSAKDAGLWILGSSEHAALTMERIPRDRPWLVVIGNEEHGLRRLTLELCDETCRIAARGPIASLNASVAAGVLMATLTGEA